MTVRSRHRGTSFCSYQTTTDAKYRSLKHSILHSSSNIVCRHLFTTFLQLKDRNKNQNTTVYSRTVPPPVPPVPLPPPVPDPVPPPEESHSRPNPRRSVSYSGWSMVWSRPVRPESLQLRSRGWSERLCRGGRGGGGRKS